MGCTRQLSGFVFVYERGARLLRSLAGPWASAFRQCMSAPSVLSLPLGVVVRVVRTAGLVRLLSLQAGNRRFYTQITDFKMYRMLMYKMAQPRHHSMLGVKSRPRIFRSGKRGRFPVR